MSDKIFLGQKVGNLLLGDPLAPVTRVQLSVDGEHVYLAGDTTGRTLEVTCPWGTQEMAESILQAVSGVSLRPYTAEDTLLDPAAELGDGVIISGLQSVLATEAITMDQLYTADIGAPATRQLSTGQSYRPSQLREQDREFSRTRTLITKSADSIRLEVLGLADDLDGLSASIQLELDSITQEVQGLDGQMSNITQKMDSITAQVTGLDGEVTSMALTLDGMTVTDADGTTKIKGSRIETGSLVLTGSITWEDLDSGVQGDINDRGISASRCRTIINDQLVSSPTIAGGTFMNLNETHWMEMSNSSGGNGDYGTFRLYNDVYGDVPYFSVFDSELGVVALFAAGLQFLWIDASDGEMLVRPKGTWDFSKATVTGI